MKIIKAIATVAAVLVMLDVLILFASLAQVGLEGRTGYWAPFWKVQAEFVISLLK